MSQASAPAPSESRAAYVISQVYYYLASVIGVALVMGGAIGALFGVREMILPREFESVDSGVRTLLHGLCFALPGLALMWWHLRQARHSEARPASTAFWGRVLYFHLMAFVALIFVLIGGIGLLNDLVDAATAGSVDGSSADYRRQAFRNAVDSSIYLIVAGPVFWWHLRQGRRLTAPPDAET